MKNLISAFKKFATNIPFYGYSIICLDNKNSKKIAAQVNTRKIITFDYKNQKADVNITKIISRKNNTFFSIKIKKNIIKNYKGKYKFNLNLLAKHNIFNATASIIVTLLINVPIRKIQIALNNFQGVKRRFTFLGKIKKSSIYDDYAHHPVEIEATYEIAKIISKKRIIVVFQPHRFSRTKDLYFDFLKILKKIDVLVVCDIYPAGEKKIRNINSSNLVKDIKKNNSKEVYYLNAEKNLNKVLSIFYEQENLIIFMGAGSITHWAKKLMEENGIYKD